jgi:YidC/Oxa1 family membrane protein insertase
VPFGMLMKFFYDLCGNYALTLLFFTIVVQIILLPFGIKQQKSQIRMAQIKPKEQVIRKKYAGRTDAATQQKMQQEVMGMYKQENYSPMSGCLPMLIQLPIIIALYGIVRHPLTYIAGFSAELMNSIKDFIIENQAQFSDYVSATMDARNFQEIDVVKVLMDHLDSIRNAMMAGDYLTGIADADLFIKFENMNFDFFNQSLLTAPSEAFFSVLMLIPVLNFAVVFTQTRLTKILQKNSTLGDAANNKAMKMMEWTMPLMIVYFTYIMSSALGLYWIYRSIVALAQTIILSRVMPIPAITDADIKRAEEQYGGTVKKKKKKKKPVELLSENEDDEDESEKKLEKISKKAENFLKNAKENQSNDDIYNEAENPAESNGTDNPSDGDGSSREREVKINEENEVSKKSEDEKYLSKTVPQGANPAVKNNYQKTGKKYTVKRRNGDKKD